MRGETGLPSQESVPTGGADPLTTFYRAEYPAAVRLAVALTLSPEAGEDIAQEAFARLGPRLASLDNPAAYLRITIVNLVRQDHRRRQREQRHLRRLDPPVRVAEAPAGELFDVLARLPTRQRVVVVLRYWAGWSESEIAAAVGCRPGTVKTLASRGLTRLRKQLT